MIGQRIIAFKSAAFLAVFGLLFSTSTTVLLPYRQSTSWVARFRSFYDQPKNTIDVLYLGSSYVYSGVIPLEIWKNQGYTGFIRANPMQSALLSYYYLVEALHTQKPKYVVVEISQIYRNINVDANEGILRRGVDPMNFSLTKLQLIRDIVEISDHQTVVSYLFPLLRYHYRWDEIEWADFGAQNQKSFDIYKGYPGISLDSKPMRVSVSQEDPADEHIEIKQSALDYYEKIVRLCQKEDIQVVFITFPGLKWSPSMHREVQDLAFRYEIPYLDFTQESALQSAGIDINRDFLDGGHLNTYGAQKISLVLGDFLYETHEIQNHRDDPAFQQWNEDLEHYEDDLSLAIQP